MKPGLLALAVALAGCKPAPAATTAVDNAAAPDADYLVWTQPEDGARATTIWLDADGREQGRTDGIVIARGGALYRLERTEDAYAMASCEEDVDDPVPGAGRAVTLELVSLDGVTRIALNTTGESDEIGSYDHGATLRGSLGRLLFVEERIEVYACGAHGDGTVIAHVFDLDHRAVAPPVASADDVAHLQAEARAALDAEATDAGFEPWEGEPTLGETLPAWRDGTLAVSHLLWVDACYACSNGAWSSYTSGVWIDDDQVPPVIAAEGAAVPPVIARMIAAQAQPHGLSWGAADDAWRAHFAAR